MIFHATDKAIHYYYYYYYYYYLDTQSCDVQLCVSMTCDKSWKQKCRKSMFCSEFLELELEGQLLLQISSVNPFFKLGDRQISVHLILLLLF
jgi:hypothetical protein